MWTDDDVEEALEWQRLRDEICSGCGQPRSESFAAENERAYTVRALVCHGCAAREHEARMFAEGGGDAAGLHLAVAKTTK